MVKTVLAVIVGYVVMLLAVFATFTALYLALGADGAFKPGTYEVSGLWLVASFVLSLVAAILGGMACARVAGNASAAKALAVVVFVLGVVMAWPAFNPETDTRPTVRASDVPNMEAMMNARQPAWVALSLPLVGAIGALIGGARVRPRS
jgi:hypothetical protein